jgi:tripartite-type tricarboxylate transporter receptor subunit TctC
MGRLSISLVVAAGVALAANAALAQDYPTRSIRWLQGFAPGGNADAISRLLSDEMSKSFKQTITVEAKPGAGGNLASAEVAKATPDGYTLMLFTTGHVISAAMYKQLPFDPINDFAYLTTVSELPFLIVVNPAKSPHKTFAELVTAAKAKPGSLTVGTAGVGTGQHLATELLNSMIGAKVVHVPHRGDSGAVTVLLSGDIDCIVAPMPAIQGHLQAGTLKALATTAAKPWPGITEVPTIASIVPGYEMIAWTGVATTKGTPKPVVDKLNAELRRILALPNVQAKLREYGGEPASSTPEEVTEKVKTNIARFNKVIDEAKIPRQ